MSDENPFKALAEAVVNEVRKDRHGPKPEPDKFDPDKLPYGVAPGNNNLGFKTCPFCGKEATETGENALPKAFLFRDYISAKEYRLSGLCQSCQDETFKEPEEED